jgi:anti-anti-sigma factor
MKEVGIQEGRVFFRPSRDLVASSLESYRKELLRALEQAPGGIEIDLGGVGMVDSMGIGLLVAAHNTAQANGGKLRLKGVSPDIRELLSAMRLTSHFEIEDSESRE